MLTMSSVTQLPTSAEHVYAFDVHGHLTAEESDVLAKLMNDAFDRHERVNMLFRLTRFEGSDATGLFDWDVLKSRFRSLSKVDRYAVVGAPDAARSMIETMDKVISVDARTFDTEDEAAAWDFVGSAPPV